MAMALGQLVMEQRGRITSTRVLSDGKVEVSFQSSGTLLGVDHTSITTYLAEARPDGTLYGEGQGVWTTKEGDVASFKGAAVGRRTGRGLGASYRGAVYAWTASPKLARLNSVALVFENEVDENGNTVGKVWEWK
jgi:hypothetical protein